MTKLIKDKIIFLAGSALLGYYLGISLFQGIIRSGLLRILPPINSRHLTLNIYSGIIGAVLGILLAYFLFTFLVERKSFKQHKTYYFIATLLLFLVPLMVLGIFRVHAINLVSKAENTTPTEITIRSNREGNSLMFKTSPSSASGVAKSISVTGSDLEEMGRMIRELELKEVVEHGQGKFKNPQLTMWLTYRPSGKWYSKIISYEGGLFQEDVAANRLAYFENPKLEKLLEKLLENSSKIENYESAEIITSSLSESDKIIRTALDKEDFRLLVSSLKSENLITGDTEGILRIKGALENWVPREERNIYGIELWQKGAVGKNSSNFMVYDKLTKTLMFGEKYFQVDLNKMIE